MFSIVLTLIAFVCFLLIVAVMVQNPKGGGLSSTLGGSQMLGGVQKTTDFLDKSTWFLALALMVLIFLSSMCFPGRGEVVADEATPATAQEAPAPKADKTATPTAPAPEKK